MQIQALRAKEPGNLRLTLGLSAVLLAAWGAGTLLGAWSPKRGLGLAFGILAALLFLFEMGYPAGRRWPGPLANARVWLQAHVYLGAVAFLAVLAHADFSWPHGAMGWWLLGLSAWTTLTGFAGVWLQKWIPSAIAHGLKVEALLERIPGMLEALRAEADTLAAGSDETLEGFYRREIRPGLERLDPSWAYLLDVRAGRDRALAPLERMRQFVREEDRGKLDDLKSIVIEKLELDAHARLQGLLRRWLLLHVPPAGLLIGLMLIHVYTWMRY